MLTIHTEGWFDAAHHLDNYDGACANLHGHTYKVEVWVKGNLNQLQENGILWDFGKLKKHLKQFDHAGDMTVNLGFNSTAENQVVYLYKKLHEENPDLLFKIRVYEQVQPKQSWAEIGDFD